MRKLLGVIGGIVLLTWYVNFDPDEYLSDQLSHDATTDTPVAQGGISSDKETPVTNTIDETSENKPIEDNSTADAKTVDKITPKKKATNDKTAAKITVDTTKQHTAIKPSEINNYIFPLKNKSKKDIISFYGELRGKEKRMHEGIDIPEKRGTPIVAVADGKIVKATHKGNAGKQVWLEVDSKTFFYAHLDSILVVPEQLVKQGDTIGTVGNTGNAKHTLPHLHFGVYVGKKTIDPVPFF